MRKKRERITGMILVLVLAFAICLPDGITNVWAANKTVAKAVSAKNYNPALQYGSNSRYLPDFGFFTNLECRRESVKTTDDKKTTVEKYTVPKESFSALEDYIWLLQEERFHLKLADTYYKDYGKDVFASYTFVYTGTGKLTLQKNSQFSELDYNLNIWYSYNGYGDYTLWLYYSPEFKVKDTLDRVGGKTVSNPAIKGKSARKAVIRTSKGVYQTSDKRLSTKAGYADIIVNGKHYKKKVTFSTDGAAGDGFVTSKTIDYFKIDNYRRSEDLFISFPYESSEDGDLYGMSELMYREPLLWDDIMFHNKSHPTRFGIQLDNKNYLTAHGNPQNIFQYMTVRVADWNKKGVTLIYFAAKLEQPGEEAYTIEGLIAAKYQKGSSSGGSSEDSSSGGGSSGGSTSTFKKDCSICNGSGKCSTCNGRGYLYSSASGKYDRNCYKCNTSGKCTYCGGSGKQK